MKRIRVSMLVALATAAVAVLAFGQAKESKPGPLTGSWQCMSHGGSNGDMQFTLDLQQKGENVSGSVSSPIGGADISSATFKKHTLEIHIDTDQANYVLTARLKNHQLVAGQWSNGGGEKGTWEGKKAPKTETSQ